MHENALIGHTGFVGSTLMAQADFPALYRSTNIDEIRGRSFDTVVCAGAPGVKWKANASPAQDKAAIDSLMRCLDQVACRRLILISTVDVFADPVGVDETSPVIDAGLQPYGLHRRQLEQFVAARFHNALTVRLPGLVGAGLRKNVIFDLKHGNNLAQIDPRGVFQFYPMMNLWKDIAIASDAGLRLVHLTAEPISVEEIALEGFGVRLPSKTEGEAARYDFRTRHAALFGTSGAYQYDKAATLAAVRDYARGA
ncbi:pyridine nucleotide transhydrogenase [Massilia sp. Dwa41.01b]|uniref:pyridine nucleotide transhydrogenase n=1 Tax=unclassified Massilia TaxID=2609279 RepID=UPI001600F2FF|nr:MULTISPECIES: pyridine nucleotide transhydrogenase [unclassified Massilia]QNA88520.1 pyridine nucleotide transhydrogenase [Massilia sp. Dwa41.01b]QNA99417.1 pyridine nucleotide transhydrogenase [Massilia sp. Se16.2.3]